MSLENREDVVDTVCWEGVVGFFFLPNSFSCFTWSVDIAVAGDCFDKDVVTGVEDGNASVVFLFKVLLLMLGCPLMAVREVVVGVDRKVWVKNGAVLVLLLLVVLAVAVPLIVGCLEGLGRRSSCVEIGNLLVAFLEWSIVFVDRRFSRALAQIGMDLLLFFDREYRSC